MTHTPPRYEDRKVEPVEPDGKLGIWEILQRVTQVASAFVVPILLWGVSAEIRLQRIQDQTALQIQHYVEANVPPEWFRKSVEKIEMDSDRDRQLLQALNVEVKTLGTEMKGLTTRMDGFARLLREP